MKVSFIPEETSSTSFEAIDKITRECIKRSAEKKARLLKDYVDNLSYNCFVDLVLDAMSGSIVIEVLQPLTLVENQNVLEDTKDVKKFTVTEEFRIREWWGPNTIEDIIFEEEK